MEELAKCKTERNLKEKATTFWAELKSMRDGNNELRFECLSKFMCGLLALPHSSACVERVFSQLKMVKTKQTSRFCVPKSNRLLGKQAISRQEVPCYQWQPSRSLIRDVKSGQCYRRCAEREQGKEERVAKLHPAVEMPLRAKQTNPQLVYSDSNTEM